jgi:hypothetical protein
VVGEARSRTDLAHTLGPLPTSTSRAPIPREEQDRPRDRRQAYEELAGYLDRTCAASYGSLYRYECLLRNLVCQGSYLHMQDMSATTPSLGKRQADPILARARGCIADRRFTNGELLCLRLALEPETSI